MWTIRILLMHYGANLRSEIALQYFALQSFGILISAPVLLGLSKRICIWQAEKRNYKCFIDSSTLILSTLRNTEEKKKKKDFITLHSIFAQLSPNCLWNESMGRTRPSWISQQYCQILRLSEPLAINSFLLKMHYSYSCCSLLNNGLRKHVPGKKILYCGKSYRKRNTTIPHSLVRLYSW